MTTESDISIEDMMKEISSKLPINHKFVISCNPSGKWFTKIFKIDINAANPRDVLNVIKVYDSYELWTALSCLYDWFLNDYLK